MPGPEEARFESEEDGPASTNRGCMEGSLLA
jgi:hypothetical protein